MTRRTFALAIAICAAPAGTAQAATVYASDDDSSLELRYEADRNESNRLTVTYDAATGSYVFRDPGAGRMTPAVHERNEAASLCTFEPRRTLCAGGPDQDVWLWVRGHDRDDAITAQVAPPTDLRLLLNGDEGDDVIESHVTFDPVLNPQSGSALGGGEGDDVLRGSDQDEGFTGGLGADVIVGGGGVDSNDFWRHATAGVHATLDGIANDGPPGEGDNLDPSIEQITGTPFDDVLIGGPGAQFLDGEKGDDRLVGGPGPDELWGRNGDDVIEARDGEADRVVCGGDADTVFADLHDLTNPQVQFESPQSCESVQVGL